VEGFAVNKTLSLGRKHAAERAAVRLLLEHLENRNLPSPVNVLVNNVAEDTTAQDTQSETTIALGAGGTIIAGFNDSEENVGGANHFTGFANSTNGGTSFTDGGALPSSSVDDAGDPVLAVNASTGAVYFTTLSFNVTNQIEFFTSTNNGASFTGPVNSAPGFSSRHILDKDWMAVDNFAGSGNGNIYTSFTDFQSNRDNGIKFDRSTDGGSTWSSAISLGGAQGSNIVVGPDHSVYVFFWNVVHGRKENIQVRKSTNQGASFGPAVTVAALATTGSNGDLGLGFRTNAFPQAAVNAANGNLYVVWNDKGAGTDRGDIFFSQSTDGGATWSAPIKLNDDATTNDQWQPAIAVTPDGTHVFVTWYDRRLDPANSLIDRFGVIGTISGSTITFGANGRITDTSFPAVFGQDPAINATYMGDYDQAAADNSFFYTTWGDNRLSDAAHANQPDVRFAKVAVTGITAPALVNRAAFVADSLANKAPAASHGSGAQQVPGYAGGVYLTRFNEGNLIAISLADSQNNGKGESSTATIVHGSADQQIALDQFWMLFQFAELES
jgi:hypothetical protein